MVRPITVVAAFATLAAAKPVWLKEWHATWNWGPNGEKENYKVTHDDKPVEEIGGTSYSLPGLGSGSGSNSGSGSGSGSSSGSSSSSSSGSGSGSGTGSGSGSSSGSSSATAAWTPEVKNLFSTSMAYLDSLYDKDYGYLWNPDPSHKGQHETRSSAWYACGLLARNKGNDSTEAQAIISNIVRDQYTDNPEDQWYGDYRKYPEEPAVGSAANPAKIYSSWDPNWRGFVGTTLVVILEEYGNLLPKTLVHKVEQSLRITAVGDSYRVGGVDGDNLYPSYSNPSLMRAVVAGWIGRRLNIKNHTDSGEYYAKQVVDLFDQTNTLSEYNSPTYAGIQTYALTLWCSYLPKDSIMTQQGPKIVRATWNTMAKTWHPGFKNLAGPWDRSYGYDTNRYMSVMALWFWAFLGKDASGVEAQPQDMYHNVDYPQGPIFSVLAAKHKAILPDGFLDQFTTVKEHFFESEAYYPPYDHDVRHMQTWVSEKLTMGSMTYNETGIGGPTFNTQSFSPCVAQWQTGDNELGFLRLIPSQKALTSKLSAGKFSLTYPKGDATAQFTFMVPTFSSVSSLKDLSTLPGLKVSVSGNINTTPTAVKSTTSESFAVWEVTYSMPNGFTGTPQMTLELQAS